MELHYTRAESTVRPSEIEVGITTVYFRRNIAEKQRSSDVPDAPPVTMYVYEEATLNKDQALQFLLKRNSKTQRITEEEAEKIVSRKEE